MEQVPDVLKSAANAYKLLMENEKVRVLDILLKSGEKAPTYNHPILLISSFCFPLLEFLISLRIWLFCSKFFISTSLIRSQASVILSSSLVYG